ncbi:MAG: LamG domain-containing protein [Pseudomonadota bacterium]
MTWTSAWQHRGPLRARTWGALGALLAMACAPHRLEVVECVEACPDASGGTAGDSSGATGGASTGGTAGEPPALFHESLLHRYDFEGSGTDVVDRVGDAHGTLIGTELTVDAEGRGAAVLAGRYIGQYIELPSGIISGLHNATFEAWVTWDGQRVWERILDFGDAFIGSDGAWLGSTYLFLTPRTPTSIGALMRVGHKRLDLPELVMDAEAGLPVGTRTHVALVVDNDRHVLQLFQNGQLVATQAIVDRAGQSFHAFATLNDTSNWLGRSQFEQDAFFGGTFHEFRIYGAALSASEIAASALRGPDPE